MAVLQLLGHLGRIALAVVAVALVLTLLLAILAALLFFVGVVSVGWMSVLAPEAELAALSPGRRRLVQVRATVVLALFWLALLGVNSTSHQHRDRGVNEGHEAFARSFRVLRWLAGLPATVPTSLTPRESVAGPPPPIAP